jgi:hypothetical protein
MSNDPTTWGVQANGFVCPTQQEILERIELDQHAYISPNWDTSLTSPNGQNNGIFSRQAALFWEGLQALNAAQSRDGAEGDLLLQHGKMTGTPRGGPTPTIVSVINTLTAGTLLEHAVDFVQVFDHPEVLFTPVADYTAATTGSHTIAFECAETGPQSLTAGTLRVIATPKTGWTYAIDTGTAVLGSDGESDEDFRTAQEEDLTKAGAGTAAALAADLPWNSATETGVPGVLGASVLENITDDTDVNGLPPHSIEPVIYADGTMVTATLAQAIWEGKAAGAGTYGQLSASYVDDTGTTRTVWYSVVTVKPIYLTYTITKDTTYAGDTAAKEWIVADLAARFGVGETVQYLYAAGRPFELSGVTDVTDCRIGSAATPTGTSSIVMGSVREIPTFDPARVVIVGGS